MVIFLIRAAFQMQCILKGGACFGLSVNGAALIRGNDTMLCLKRFNRLIVHLRQIEKLVRLKMKNNQN